MLHVFVARAWAWVWGAQQLFTSCPIQLAAANATQNGLEKRLRLVNLEWLGATQAIVGSVTTRHEGCLNGQLNTPASDLTAWVQLTAGLMHVSYLKISRAHHRRLILRRICMIQSLANGSPLQRD